MERRATINTCIVLFLIVVILAAIIAFMPENSALAQPNYVTFDMNMWQNFISAEIDEAYFNEPDLIPLPTRIVIEAVESSSITDEIVFEYDYQDPTIYIKYRDMFDGIAFDTSQDTSFLFYYRDGDGLYGAQQYTSIFSYVIEIVGLDNFVFSTMNSSMGMFEEMRCLDKLDLSFADFANCARMAYMFYNCTSLTSLKLPTSTFGSQCMDKRGMFYGLDSLLELDLSKFVPEFDQNVNYEEQNNVAGRGEFGAFIKADNLQILKTPDAQTISNNTTYVLPQTLANSSIGEFAENVNSIHTTLGSMLLAKTTFYKVGHIKYVIKINDTFYTLGTDTYLASVAYESKTFELTYVNQIIKSSGAELRDNISAWDAILEDGRFSGGAGKELSYTTQNPAYSLYISPKAYSENNPIELVYEYLDSNIPINPDEDTDTDQEETPTVIPEHNPVIEETDVEEEGNGLSKGEVAGIVGGSVAGAGALSVLIGALATFRFTEIDGVTKLVFMIKKSAEDCTVINFKGKRFKIKRKSLRRRKKKKDDDDDDDDDKWFKKIPIFYIKWLK